MSERVSIGRVKRDISQLVNRVAYGSERIILTSRGKPKAALVSMEDYERLRSEGAGEQERMRLWMRQTKTAADEILQRRDGERIDVDEILSASRRELEERDDRLTHRS